MRLSFYDESSMVEESIGSLCFAPQDVANLIPENGIVDEERRHDDDSEVQLSGDPDIQMVDR